MDDLQQFPQSLSYIETLRAVSRLTYMSMYVIDYELKGFEYVSDNPFFLCNRTPAEVMELGYDFYFKHIASEDLEMLIKVNEIGFNFFDRIPLPEKKNYSISYDVNLLNGKEKILVNHKLTPLFMTSERKIGKALCLVSLSANSSSGNIMLSKAGGDSFWELDISNATWHKIEKKKLTERELQMLRLHAQGLNISEISKRMCISIDTVKFHRKNLFEKLSVKNITEALAYATTNKLL